MPDPLDELLAALGDPDEMLRWTLAHMVVSFDSAVQRAWEQCPDVNTLVRAGHRMRGVRLGSRYVPHLKLHWEVVGGERGCLRSR